jgi:hypothetical protein
MNRSLFAAAAAAFAFGSCAGQAHSAELTYTFAGHLTSVGGSLNVGDPFSGSFRFDGSQAGAISGFLPTARDYIYDSFDLTIGGSTQHAGPDVFEIDDNGTFLGDRFDLTLDPGTAGGLPYWMGHFRLVNVDDTAISSNQLPLNTNLSDWPFAEVRLYTTYVDIIGHVDSLALSATPTLTVPEPATWAIMLLGFGALGGALRNRRGQLVA